MTIAVYRAIGIQFAGWIEVSWCELMGRIAKTVSMNRKVYYFGMRLNLREVKVFFSLGRQTLVDRFSRG